MPFVEKDRYDLPMQALHWLVALLIIAAFAVIQLTEGMPRGPERVAMMTLHKSLGASVLALVLIRMVWRVARPVPAPPDSMTPLMELAAKLGHLALYVLMVAVPLSGILMTQAKGREVGVWGLFTLPTLIAPDKALGKGLEEVHEIVGNLLLILAGLHAVVALVHQFVLKDNLMARMRPWGLR